MSDQNTCVIVTIENKQNGKKATFEFNELDETIEFNADFGPGGSKDHENELQAIPISFIIGGFQSTFNTQNQQ